jgi:phage protein D
MAAVNLRAASKTFADFYVPRYEILASGKGLDTDVLRDVTQVTYNDSITEIDSFDLTVNNWDPVKRDFKYVGAETTVLGSTSAQKLFNPCAGEFELRMGYGSELATIMRGSTTSLEPQFPGSGAPTLTVRALNVLHKLRTKQYRDHWQNKRISDVAEDIGRRNDKGGKKRFPLPVRVDEKARRKEPKLDYIAQDNQYDIDFLLLEARKIGYVVYIDLEPAGKGKTREVLRFAPSDARHPGVPDVSYELEWGVSLMDFTPKLSTANQVKSVEVRSQDRQSNKAIKEKVDLHAEGLANKDLLALLEVKGCEAREEVVVNEPQYTKQQARRRATAVLSDRLKQLVEGNGTTVGLPNLRAGQRVLIRGFGARFSGTYFVTRTTHTLNDSGYTTKFTARREAADPKARSAFAVQGVTP